MSSVSSSVEGSDDWGRVELLPLGLGGGHISSPHQKRVSQDPSVLSNRHCEAMRHRDESLHPGRPMGDPS